MSRTSIDHKELSLQVLRTKGLALGEACCLPGLFYRETTGVFDFKVLWLSLRKINQEMFSSYLELFVYVPASVNKYLLLHYFTLQI